MTSLARLRVLGAGRWAAGRWAAGCRAGRRWRGTDRRSCSPAAAAPSRQAGWPGPVGRDGGVGPGGSPVAASGPSGSAGGSAAAGGLAKTPCRLQARRRRGRIGGCGVADGVSRGRPRGRRRRPSSASSRPITFASRFGTSRSGVSMVAVAAGQDSGTGTATQTVTPLAAGARRSARQIPPPAPRARVRRAGPASLRLTVMGKAMMPPPVAPGPG